MKNVFVWYIKKPVRTSQGTHYVSATEARHLMLCKLSGFDGGNYKEFRPLVCDAVWVL
jgi:hypothetical protein